MLAALAARAIVTLESCGQARPTQPARTNHAVAVHGLGTALLVVLLPRALPFPHNYSIPLCAFPPQLLRFINSHVAHSLNSRKVPQTPTPPASTAATRSALTHRAPLSSSRPTPAVARPSKKQKAHLSLHCHLVCLNQRALAHTTPTSITTSTPINMSNKMELSLDEILKTSKNTTGRRGGRGARRSTGGRPAPTAAPVGGVAKSTRQNKQSKSAPTAPAASFSGETKIMVSNLVCHLLSCVIEVN